MTQTATPPLLPVRAMHPRRKPRRGKQRRKTPSSDDESSYASAEERATPKKSNRDEKAEQIAWVNWDHASKWKKDLAHINKYRQ